MVEMFLALAVVGVILVISEFLLRKKMLHGELARKFVHIVAGTFIATWSFYLDTREIQILSGILLIGVIVSKLLSIFNSVHGVARQTWGEIFFAISIGLTATFAQNKWVFAAAILHMSLADGFAAIIGTKYGKRSGYTVMGQYKTLVGSMVFYALSVAIMTWLFFFTPVQVAGQAWIAVLWVPLLATITENLAIKGFDNVAVPLVIIAAVQLLSVVAV